MKWNFEGLIREAKEWQEGKQVNWTDVARLYNVHQPSDESKLAAIGGQIVQAVLSRAGVDVTHFLKGKGELTNTPRRAVKRLRPGISLLAQTKLCDLERKIEELYQTGAIPSTINIVPHTYKQVKQDGQGTCNKTI